MVQQTQINRIIELGVSQVNINARDQGLAIAALAQDRARARVAASAPAALIDNSTGTASGIFALVAVITPTIAAVDNVVVMAPKTAFDTAMGLIEDANEELLAKTNELIVLLASAAAANVDEIVGATADNDTILAIAKTLTGTTADDAGVDASTGIAQVVVARNNASSIASAVNWCRVAMGLAPLTDASGGVFDRTNMAWPTTSSAATGVAAANMANSLTDATVDATLTALVDNVASLAAAINQMRGALAIGPFVIATNNPRTRFVTADTTV